MRVRGVPSQAGGQVSFELLDDADQPIPIVTSFLQHLAARGYSPNTLSAYAHDLQHFLRFLAQQDLDYTEFLPPYALLLLEYLRGLPGRDHVQRLSPVLCTSTDGQSGARLSAPTINRILAAVSSFYEYLILSEQLTARENPIQQTDDPARARVAERHRPALGRASRQRPIRRVVRLSGFGGHPGCASPPARP